MKESERKINFRPELAKQLQTLLSQINILYKANFQSMYYRLYADIFKESNQLLYDTMMASAECYKDKFYGEEEFDSNYRDILKEHGISICSEAKAASFVFYIYEQVLQEYKEEFLKKDLTKAEQLQIKRFFSILMTPLRNPNIQISEGQTECLYDRDYRYSFSKDMESSLEYINKECPQIIELFNAPEEMEEIQTNVLAR